MRRNRVDPYGRLITTPARGLVFGNRGCLHDDRGAIRRSWAGRRWIACLLDFRGRRRALLQPGRYTELFFLDEATAFAAGHRPCAECRHEDYVRFADAWHHRHGERRADAIDRCLHTERLEPSGERRRYRTRGVGLPVATMIELDGAAWVVLGDRLARWSPEGYGRTRALVESEVTILTPPSLVALLRIGWSDAAVPLLHPSAGV